MNGNDVNIEGNQRPILGQRAWKRWTLAPAALLVVALGAAACGSGTSHRPGVAGSGAATTMAPASGSSGSSSQSGASGRSLALQYSECMRAHGVTNFPDPQGDQLSKLGPNSGIDTNSSAFQAAESACRQYTQGATVSATERANLLAGALRFSQCMRSDGDTTFPDPTLDPVTGLWRFSQSGHDRDTPAYQSAYPRCQSLMPQPPAGVSNNGG